MERFNNDRTESRENRQASTNSELCLTSLMERSPSGDASRIRTGKSDPTENLDFSVSNPYHTGEDPSFKSALESIPARDRSPGSGADSTREFRATASGDGALVDGRILKANESSLENVLKQAKAGDKVLLADGTYNKKVDVSVSGAEGKNITIAPEHPGRVEFKDGGGFKVTGDNVTISGMKFDNCSQAIAMENSSGSVVTGNEFTNGKGHQIELTKGSNNVRISDNEFAHSDSRGIQINATMSGKGEPSTGTVIEGNTFSDYNQKPPIRVGTQFMDRDVNLGTVIKGNTFKDINIDPQVGNSELISMKSSGLTFADNRIENVHGYVTLRSGGNSTIENNQFINASGIKGGEGYNKVMNNTFVLTDKEYKDGKPVQLLQGDWDGKGVPFRNPNGVYDSHVAANHWTVSGNKFQGWGDDPIGTPDRTDIAGKHYRFQPFANDIRDNSVSSKPGLPVEPPIGKPLPPKEPVEPPIGRPGRDSDILFGGFVAGGPNGDRALKDALGRRETLEQFYSPMGGNIDKLTDTIQKNINEGVLPEVSLNPKANDFTAADIASGRHDAYFHQLANELGDLKTPDGQPADIMLRPGWEFNLRHSQHFVGSPEQFTSAWKHIHDIFEQEGADNVKFVWSPGHGLDTSGLGRGADASKYWPGADYVDVIGPDSYSNANNKHKSFNELFGQNMDFASRIGKPFMVSETGVDGSGFSERQQADWWRSAYDTLKSRQAAGLDVIGIAGFFKEGDWGWGHRDYRIEDGGLEQQAIQQLFFQNSR